MGESSAIEWTESTWNPWHGCLKVSPGCAHCYMYRDKRRYGQDPALVVRSKTSFDAPRKWKNPKMIFTCSWSDFFVQEADQWRAEAWEVIRATPHHTYQILTKRPERISDHLPDGWPFRNVWLGVSVENPRFYQRIESLRAIPASVRFLSRTATRTDVVSAVRWHRLGGCRRRIRAAVSANESRVGTRNSGAMHEGRSRLFLQTVGWPEEGCNGPGSGRQDMERNADAAEREEAADEKQAC